MGHKVNDDEQRINQDAGDDALRDGADGGVGDFLELQRLREAVITSDDGNDETEENGFAREQNEIEAVQCAASWLEIIAGAQGDILQERPEIAAGERGDDEINGERKNADRHADDARDDEVMHGVDAEGFEGFDFAEGAGGAEFDDVGGADAREHEQRRNERSQFAHHDDDHDGPEIFRGAETRGPGNGLANDEQAKRDGDEKKHRQQLHAGAGDFVKNERANDVPRRAEFFDQHTQCDERESAEALDGEQEAETVFVRENWKRIAAWAFA